MRELLPLYVNRYGLDGTLTSIVDGFNIAAEGYGVGEEFSKQLSNIAGEIARLRNRLRKENEQSD